MRRLRYKAIELPRLLAKIEALLPAASMACGVVSSNLSSQLLHDLRSPLNQIIGYSEMLTEDADAERREDFGSDLIRIRAAGHRMLAVIEENFTSDTERVITIALADEEESSPDLTVVLQPVVAPGLVLVVDDDADNRDVLSRRLTRQGHDVKTASSGREALQLVSESAFDLVLLDIMMPDMDGYEVLKQIKAEDQLHHIPVIMISARQWSGNRCGRCIEAGAERYLAKTVQPDFAQSAHRACLEKKRGRDRRTVLFEQLQKNYKRLQEVEKLRDDMRNMIVQDLRTPLTAVIVGVERCWRSTARSTKSSAR